MRSASQAIILALSLLVGSVGAGHADLRERPAPSGGVLSLLPLPQTTEHTIAIAGRTLEYRAKAGTLSLLSGSKGLGRAITSPYIQKTGLALAGFHEYLQPGRVLIYGDSELRFLETLPPAARQLALQKSFEKDVPCLLVTATGEIPADVIAESERAHLPVLRTTVPTAAAIVLNVSSMIVY